MTIHIASIYFDHEKHKVGYLLSSDTWAAETDDKTNRVNSVFHLNKSFTGTRTVGFIRGTLPSYEDDTPARVLSDLRTLDYVFDDIQEGIDYSNNGYLSSLEKYVLLIGAISEASLELYTISNVKRAAPHTAKMLHRLTFDMYDQALPLAWYAPCSSAYLVIDIGKRLNLEESRVFAEDLTKVTAEHLPGAIQSVSLDKYDLGEIISYCLSEEGIRTI
jgi:hypothetical protein